MPLTLSIDARHTLTFEGCHEHTWQRATSAGVATCSNLADIAKPRPPSRECKSKPTDAWPTLTWPTSPGSGRNYPEFAEIAEKTSRVSDSPENKLMSSVVRASRAPGRKTKLVAGRCVWPIYTTLFNMRSKIIMVPPPWVSHIFSLSPRIPQFRGNVGHVRADRCCSNLVNVGPNFVELEPHLIGVGPNLSDSGPILVDSWPVLVECGRARSNLG